MPARMKVTGTFKGKPSSFTRTVYTYAQAIELIAKHGYTRGYPNEDAQAENRIVWIAQDFDSKGRSVAELRLARGRYRNNPVGRFSMEEI